MTDIWPEQNAIDSWFKEHGLVFRNEQLLVLKNEVTKARVEAQDRLEQANKDKKELATALKEATNFMDVAFRPERIRYQALAEKHL